MNNITDLTLKIWRQAGPDDEGHFETYEIGTISEEASFLELLDVLNEWLILRSGRSPSTTTAARASAVRAR